MQECRTRRVYIRLVLFGCYIHLLLLKQGTTTGKACHNTDKSTASAARAAMVDFFDTKFPELKKNPFYITGESYAGV